MDSWAIIFELFFFASSLSLSLSFFLPLPPPPKLSNRKRVNRNPMRSTYRDCPVMMLIIRPITYGPPASPGWFVGCSCEVGSGSAAKGDDDDDE